MGRDQEQQLAYPGATRAQHVGGVLLIAVALMFLAIVPLLPTRAAQPGSLPFLQDQDEAIVLAYAGFPGCGDTCPRGLAALASAHSIHEAAGGASTSLLFINVQRNTPEGLSEAFARAFHDEFRAYDVGASDAEALYDTLALRTFNDAGQAAYHSNFVYLFAKRKTGWQIEKVYRRFPSIERMAADLQQLAHEV